MQPLAGRAQVRIGDGLVRGERLGFDVPAVCVRRDGSDAAAQLSDSHETCRAVAEVV